MKTQKKRIGCWSRWSRLVRAQGRRVSADDDALATNVRMRSAEATSARALVQMAVLREAPFILDEHYKFGRNLGAKPPIFRPKLGCCEG
jgi:hypothetical protein